MKHSCLTIVIIAGVVDVTNTLHVSGYRSVDVCHNNTFMATSLEIKSSNFPDTLVGDLNCRCDVIGPKTGHLTILLHDISLGMHQTMCHDWLAVVVPGHYDRKVVACGHLNGANKVCSCNFKTLQQKSPDFFVKMLNCSSLNTVFQAYILLYSVPLNNTGETGGYKLEEHIIELNFFNFICEPNTFQDLENALLKPIQNAVFHESTLFSIYSLCITYLSVPITERYCIRCILGSTTWRKQAVSTVPHCQGYAPETSQRIQSLTQMYVVPHLYC